MASTTKKLLTNWRIILVIISLVLAAVAINPQFDTDGVAIRSIIKDSPAALSGIENPKERAAPTSLERIIAIDNQDVNSPEEYQSIISALDPNATVTIETDRGFYTIFTDPVLETEVIGEENQTVEEVVEVDQNGTMVNETVTFTKLVNITSSKVVGTADLGIRVSEVSATNLVKGLDLQGGTRVLLEPEEPLEQQDMDSLIENLKLRLNVFGLSDVIVRDAQDLDGNQFVLVEIAGANEEEVRELLAKQGKFEAQIGNQTVFRGGEDITYVCRSADCSGIDPNVGCGQSAQGFSCRFQFQISLSPEAAQRQADITSKYPLLTGDAGDSYLSEPLVLFLDNDEVDSLQIAADLRGRAVTDISISGSGAGASQELALEDTLVNMKRLQTILVTGSLPVKLNIVQTKNISPQLGDEFLNNAILLGLASILGVIVFVFIRYRKLSISLPMMFCMVSEVGLILGFAALFKWNLDLTAIAGIIIAVGTGVDDQIVITDEILEGDQGRSLSWREKIKRAFAIIMTAWGTTMVAMGPLLFAGAGLLRGFALTTMAGITFGVLITRPAFAKGVEIILNK